MVKILTLLTLPLFGICASFANDGFDIVSNGQAKTEIVLPVRANRIEKYAAGELSEHIRKSTGVLLPIVRENRLKGDMPRIYLGKTRFALQHGIDAGGLPPNAYLKKVSPQAVILAGRDGNGTLPQDDRTPMGTLFAVYDFLENNLGVRWLWPGDTGTVIPPKTTFSAGKNENKKHIPQLIHSRIREASLGNPRGLLTDEEFRNAKLERQIWMRRQRFARGESFQYGHGFELYWKRFGKTRPDFFALRPDGTRTPYDKRYDLVQMCVSNPALHKQIIDDWLNGRQSFPGEFINGCENDRRFEDGHCLCPNCLAWDADPAKTDRTQYWTKDGKTNIPHDPPPPDNLSDRYAKFWLALQAEGAKHRPNPVVIGYAYFTYSNPPVKTRLNPNILVGIVQNFDYPLDAEKRDAFRRQWEGWHKTGASLYLRPNYFLAGYTLPYIFAHQFAEDYKFAYQRGMKGTDFDSLNGMFGTQGPNLYMLARLNVEPEKDADAILDEYYQGFGAAAGKIREYFSFWERQTLKRDSAFSRKYPEGGWNPMGYSGNKLYSLADVAHAGTLLDDAEKAVRNSPGDLERVKFLKKGLRHTELTLKAMNALDDWKNDRPNQKKKKAFRSILKELDSYRHEIRNDQVVNIVFIQQLDWWMGWRGD